MKFDDLDAKMRAIETANDQKIDPQNFVVVRLDGRGFTKMTAAAEYQKPFDIRFNEAMLHTTEKLFDCGFEVLYGYTQSDEISLLMKQTATLPFNGKVRKYLSLLAARAAAAFSMEVSHEVQFDARVIELYSIVEVVDYFRWRQEDANRNALNGYAYWMLRKSSKFGPKIGMSGTAASRKLEGQGVQFKLELLKNEGVIYEEVPRWQRYGIGVQYDTVESSGFDPIRNVEVPCTRKVLKTNLLLPNGDSYSDYIRALYDSGPVSRP